MDIKVSGAVVSLFVAGALFGGLAATTTHRMGRIEKSYDELQAETKKQVDELKASHQSMLAELNQKILPQIQAELTKAKIKK